VEQVRQMAVRYVEAVAGRGDGDEWSLVS
jgi:hypothetical protein